MSTKVSSPTPPPAESTAESIDAWVKSMPTVFAEQQRQAPLEAQQQLELMQQFSLPMAQAFKDVQAALYPETQSLQEQMAQQSATGMEQGLTDQERRQYADYFKSNLGTNAGSGIGASYFADNMVQADQRRKDYYRDLGLSLAGRQPLSQPQSPQYSNYMAGFTPNSVMGYNSQNYNAYSRAYSNMYNTNAQMKQQQNAMLYDAGMGALGGFAMSSKRFKRNIKRW